MRRLLAGDAPSFERFFEVAYPVLYRFALVRLSFDRDAAGDVAQAALCKAIAKLATFKGEAALLTWLCTFCRHEIHAHRKARGARSYVELLEDDPEVRAALESLQFADGADPVACLDRTRMSALVQGVLDRLPPRYADALEWKYIHELPVQEVANRLGIGFKAAESLLTRARHAFREAFRSLDATAATRRLQEEESRG